MGNSEVGHLNIGAGRIVFQEITRIDQAMKTDLFTGNPEFLAALDYARRHGGKVSPDGIIVGRRSPQYPKPPLCTPAIMPGPAGGAGICGMGFWMAGMCRLRVPWIT